MLRRAVPLLLLTLAVLLGWEPAVEGATSVTEVTTSSPDAPYGAGATIDIEVVFSTTVSVINGPPQLLLNVGRYVSYTSGSGTNTLTFSYLVLPGDATNRLDVASSAALTLNGATMTDQSGAPVTPAELTVPAGISNPASLAYGHTIVVEQNSQPALIQELTGVQTDTVPYGVNTSLTLTATFDEPVFVDTSQPLPTLSLSSGTDAVATYIGGSGSSTLSFLYTPQPGDAASDLEVVNASLASVSCAFGLVNTALPGDSGGAPASGDLQTNKNYVIDTTPPVVQSLSTTVKDSDYGIGAVIPIAVKFSKSVTVTGGPPTLLLNTTPTEVAIFSGYGTLSDGSTDLSTLIFTYTVRGGDNDPLLDMATPSSLVQPFSVNGGTIRDLATNDADFSVLPAPGGPYTLSPTHQLVISTSPPLVLSITATPKVYIPGKTVQIFVTFGDLAGSPSTTDPVMVTGNPTLQLALTTEGGPRQALYAGSTTESLIFDYTVQPGDGASPLTVAGIVLPSGAAMVDEAGNTANLYLTPTPLPGVVIQTPPAVIGLSATPSASAGPFGVGQVITINLLFSQPVTASNVSLALNASGTAVASLVAPITSPVTTVPLQYQVASGDSAAPLDVTAAASLSGSIVGGGQSAYLTVPAPGSPGSLGSLGLVVDAVAPVITNLTSTPTTAAYGPGAQVRIVATTSAPVSITNGPISLPLNFITTSGSGIAYATCASTSLTTSLIFTYTVQPGDSDSHLDTATSGALQLGSATVQDGIGNGISTALPTGNASLGAQTQITIDGLTPVVQGYTAPPGTYYPGDAIPITCAFNDAVTVVGVPTIPMNTGHSAVYTSGSGSTVLTFTYTVQAGDNGQLLADASHTIVLPTGASILNLVSTPAQQLLPTTGSTLGSVSVLLSSAATTVQGITCNLPSAAYGAGQVMIFTVTFSNPVTVTGAPTLLLNTAPTQGVATYSAGSGTQTLTFGWTVPAGVSSALLDAASSSALQTTLVGATITDAHGANADVTLPVGSATAGALAHNVQIAIVADPGSPPRVVAVGATSSPGTYTTGQTLLLTVTFSDPVNVTGVPELVLNDQGSGSSPPVAVYTSGSGTTTLTFAYTVGANDSCTLLDEVSEGALSLPPGASIADPYRPAQLALPAPGSAGSLGTATTIAVNPNAPNGKPPPSDVTSAPPSSGGGGCGLGGGSAALLGLLLAACRRSPSPRQRR